MNINRTNYEMYMIDYLDGKLSAMEVVDLLLFIEQNPDIKKEFELLKSSESSFEIEIETINKASLKKPVYESIKNNYQDTLIANLEGDLNPEEKIKLDKDLIIYPELKKDIELFNKTKFSPDTNIVFENKQALKKSIPLFGSYKQYLWRAAAVLAIFGSVLFLTREPNRNTVAIKTTSQPTILKKNNFQDATTNHKNMIASTTVSIKDKPFKKTGQLKKFIKQHTEETVAISIHFEVIEQKGQVVINKDTETILNQTLHYLVYTPERKSIPAKEELQFKELGEVAAEQWKKNTKDVLIEVNKPDSVNKNFALADIGLLFLKVYNKTTGDDAKVVKRYDKAGKVIGVEIVANNFQFATGK